MAYFEVIEVSGYFCVRSYTDIGTYIHIFSVYVCTYVHTAHSLLSFRCGLDRLLVVVDEHKHPP